MDEDKDKNHEKYFPDYEQKCGNCGESPVVTIQNEKGKVVHDFEMCGPCTFGSAKCLDPEEWS